MSAVHTPAGRLVSAFGDAEAMRAMYAPHVEWSLSASLDLPRPMKGIDAVSAFNRQVWTEFYRPDCTVEILDETGDDRVSAARFIYRAHSNATGTLYENEYTIFVRSGPEGITEVFEGLDTAFVLRFLDEGTPKG
jgi:ketosteroid isomerase-like protein